MFKKTLREVELEEEVAGLKRAVYELQYKLGKFPSYPASVFTDASKPEMVEITAPTPVSLMRYVNLDSRVTSDFGLEVKAWGYKPKNEGFYMEYRIERDKYLALDERNCHAPYIMADLHESFLRGLSDIKRKAFQRG